MLLFCVLIALLFTHWSLQVLLRMGSTNMDEFLVTDLFEVIMLTCLSEFITNFAANIPIDIAESNNKWAHKCRAFPHCPQLIYCQTPCTPGWIESLLLQDNSKTIRNSNERFFFLYIYVKHCLGLKWRINSLQLYVDFLVWKLKCHWISHPRPTAQLVMVNSSVMINSWSMKILEIANISTLDHTKLDF